MVFSSHYRCLTIESGCWVTARRATIPLPSYTVTQRKQQMSNKDVTGHYTNFFKNWQVKTLGPKPTMEQLDAIHKLGARAGKQALASAMSLRDCGVTGGQIIIACGAPQLNKMRGFVTDGLLKREAAPKTEAGHTVYKMTLTAKGNAKVKGVTKKAKKEVTKEIPKEASQEIQQPTA